MYPKLKKLLPQVSAWAAIVVLSGSAAWAQSMPPTQAPTASEQAQPAALPDAPTSLSRPTPASAPVQPKSVVEAPAPTAKPVAQAPLTVLEDTLIRVITNESINSKRAKNGTPVLFTVSEDVVVGDGLAIPRGATVHGIVSESKKAGVLTGNPELTLKLVSLNLGGRSYPLYAYPFKVKGLSKTKPTETKALQGAYVGAIAGSFASGVSAKGGVIDDGSSKVAGMTAGAAVGAGVGAMVSAATPGPGIWIPAEAQVDFYLAAPVTVTPVSAKEAARLAQGLHPGGPSLYVRDDVHP
jgi:hypothetical protein